MKILIIGGTRFFGYHIAQRLVHDGHEVSLREFVLKAAKILAKHPSGRPS